MIQACSRGFRSGREARQRMVQKPPLEPGDWLLASLGSMRQVLRKNSSRNAAGQIP